MFNNFGIIFKVCYEKWYRVQSRLYGTQRIFISSDISTLKKVKRLICKSHLGPCTRIILLKSLHVRHRTITCNKYHITACCNPYSYLPTILSRKSEFIKQCCPHIVNCLAYLRSLARHVFKLVLLQNNGIGLFKRQR
jgi:hypothetical protein